MKNAYRFLKSAVFVVLLLFISLVVWANWQEPSLSQRLNLKPVALAVFNLDKPLLAQDSAQLARTLATTPGVTACTVNRESQTVSLTYYEDEVTESSLHRLVQTSPYRATKVNFAAFEGPKCPVPAEYLDFLTNLKTSLCFR